MNGQLDLKLGDFVLIRFPCYGLSPSHHVDLGPFMVQVTDIFTDKIEFRTKSSGGNGYGHGYASFEAIVSKIHPRDALAYMPDEVEAYK